MKLLVLGSAGMLGSAVAAYFRARDVATIALTRRDFDIASAPIEALRPYLSGVSDVVNCAAITQPAIAHSSIEDVLRVNAIFPRNLARACLTAGVRCFHVTTDGVYCGSRGGYDENDPFDAGDAYGMSKNAGETADCMTLRISVVGEERREARSLLSWAIGRAGTEVDGFTNHVWNGITTLQFAEAVESIVREGTYQKRLFHLHSPEAVTKYDLLRLIDEVYDLRLTVRAVEAPESRDRTLKSTFALSSRLVTHSIRDQLARMRDFHRAI